MPKLILIFNNYYGIYFLVFFVIPFLFFHKTEIIKFVESGQGRFFISKNVTTQLKGVFIIVVVVHHVAFHAINATLLHMFIPIGFLAVGVFLFISGFGLMKSLMIREEYLIGFFRKKIISIYIPFVITNILTLALYINMDDSKFIFGNITNYILGVKLIDPTLWFIVSILIFYSFFYFSFSTYCSVKSLFIITVLTLFYIIVCKWTIHGSYRYISSLCFPVGVYYAFFEEKINRIVFSKYYLVIILFGLVFLLTFILSLHHLSCGFTPISCVFFVIFIFIFFIKFRPHSLIFNYIGTLSLEIYLLHMKIMILCGFYTKLDSGIWLWLYFSILILSASLFHKFNNFLYQKIGLLAISSGVG